MTLANKKQVELRKHHENVILTVMSDGRDRTPGDVKHHVDLHDRTIRRIMDGLVDKGHLQYRLLKNMAVFRKAQR